MQINQLDPGFYPKARPSAEAPRQAAVLEAQPDRRPQAVTRSAPQKLVYPTNNLSEQQIAQFVRNFSMKDAERDTEAMPSPANLPSSVQSYLNISTLSSSDSTRSGLIDERV